MVADAFEAFASNPRYSPGGLEDAIDREDLEEASKKDAISTSIAKLEDMGPPKTTVSEQATEAGEFPDERKTVVKMHEDVLAALDTVTGVPRDITAGMYKAFDNTLAFALGRDNLDAGNDWVRENLPELSDFTNQFERGMAPRGTISEVTQEMSQFMVPFGLYMKGVGGLAAASNIQAGVITKSIIADVVTSGSAVDPHMERFAALTKSMGIDNRINDWLADNENETESEGRLKNILDSAGAAGLIGGGFMSAALTLKGLSRAGKFIKTPKIKPSKVKPEAVKAPEPVTEKPVEKLNGTKRAALPRKNLNKKMLIDERVLVGGAEETIQRPAGDILKDMDKRVKSLEKARDKL